MEKEVCDFMFMFFCETAGGQLQEQRWRSLIIMILFSHL